MDNRELLKAIDVLDGLDAGGLPGSDFLLSWDRSEDELRAIFSVAEILAGMRRAGLSPRLYDSGLAVSLFRDRSTRTRFSFASACDLLGLAVQDLEEGKSQIAHGETVRETAVMVSFLTEVIGIRDDMYLGRGQSFMRQVAAAVRQAHEEGVLERRPAVVNLQCDVDHPTQTLADALHLVRHFGGLSVEDAKLKVSARRADAPSQGGLDRLRGRKLVMSWAYSPSYGKPLSVPQGVIGLFTRFGMEVVLAHPEGYGLLPEVTGRAARQAQESGGSFRVVHDPREAFRGADVAYPKSWASWSAMERRTRLFDAGDAAGIAALEQELLEQNARHRDWECTEALMRETRGGQALYLHCLPADVSGVSCRQGEVEASVFERFRVALYRQAGWKPYVIAAVILLSRLPGAAAWLRGRLERPVRRVLV